MTTNQLAYMANMETIRANRAREDETHRSNLATEGERYRSNLAMETETRRSNLARETETHRANVVKETETHRSNVATEGETHRANVAKESFNIADAMRKNELTAQNILNNYILGSRQASTAESNAAVNLFNAGIGQYDAETRRIQATTGQSAQQETVRHNLTMEDLQRLGYGIQVLQSALSGVGSTIGRAFTKSN